VIGDRRREHPATLSATGPTWALELGGNVRKGEHGTRVTVITAHPAKARRCPGRAVRAEIPVRGH
jgi:antirestriction protein ArdC